MQAHLAIFVMAECGILSRHYLASVDSLVANSYHQFQENMSSQLSDDYREITMAFWRVAYSRLAIVLPEFRRIILRFAFALISIFFNFPFPFQLFIFIF